MERNRLVRDARILRYEQRRQRRKERQEAIATWGCGIAFLGILGGVVWLLYTLVQQRDKLLYWYISGETGDWSRVLWVCAVLIVLFLLLVPVMAFFADPDETEQSEAVEEAEEVEAPDPVKGTPREVFRLVGGNWDTANRLIEGTQAQYPYESLEWVVGKVVEDLVRDRR